MAAVRRCSPFRRFPAINISHVPFRALFNFDLLTYHYMQSIVGIFDRIFELKYQITL